MRKLTEDQEDAVLSPGQATEDRIGAVQHDVYQCECGERQLEANLGNASYGRCSACGHRASMISTRKISADKQRVTERCEHCKREVSRTEDIWVPAPASNRSSSSSSSSSSNWSSSSGSSDSSSSGSSSFGGGSSGGGGAGTSY